MKHHYERIRAYVAVGALWIAGCRADADASTSTVSSAYAEALSGTATAGAPSAAPSAAGGPSAAAMATPSPSLRCTADGSAPATTDYSVPGPYRVATLDMTFEDTSRPIVATDTHPAAPSRTLVTTIYFPAAPRGTLFGPEPVADGGPFPLLMYSHGYSSSRSEATHVGELAASYGYIVVAPDFPLSNLLANNGSPDGTDAHNQVGDVSYLIDQMLSFSRDPGHLFANAVDETRIGATGVSMGGFTTLLATFHPTLQDARIKVSVPIAPLSAFFMEGFYHTREVPVLFIHGDNDAFLPYKDSRTAFEYAAPNARLMTLKNGSHAAFAVQFDATTTRLLNAVMAPPDADPTNPDAFGCGGVGATLREGPSVAIGLGGEENFIDQAVADAMSPCDGDEYKRPAMDATKQVELTASAVVAMFEAHLAKQLAVQRDACSFLVHELPKDPAVTVE